MMRMPTALVAYAILHLLAGCSSPPGATPLGVASSADGGTGAAAPASLAGHWDVTGSDLDGLTRSGSVDVASGSIDVAFGDYTIHFRDGATGPTATWDDNSASPGTTRNIPAMHEKATFDSGILPLSLGGEWTLSDDRRPEAQCGAHIAIDGMTATCRNVKIQPSWEDFFAQHPYPDPYWSQYCNQFTGCYEVWGSGLTQAWQDEYQAWKNSRVVPGTNGELVGTRLRLLPSSFGDLGGEWQFASTGGANCQLEISGATITSICKGIVGDYEEANSNGTVSVHFEGGFMSGFTDKGIEFLGRRASL